MVRPDEHYWRGIVKRSGAHDKLEVGLYRRPARMARSGGDRLGSGGAKAYRAVADDEFAIRRPLV